MKLQVHALHKSGSMFLYGFFKTLANAMQVKYYSINDQPQTEHLGLIEVCPGNFIVSPIRWFPPEILPDRKYILVLRHPLDILISQYYSHGWMHPLPYDNPKAMTPFMERRNEIQQLATIDDYCLQFADELKKRYTVASESIGKKNVLLTDYAEMVCSFGGWCKKVCNFIGIDNDHFVNQMYLVYKSEFVVPTELTPEQIKNGQSRHKRKMLPGDYLEKLKPETIAALKGLVTLYENLLTV